MYYIVQMTFPNGNVVTRTIKAISNEDAIAYMQREYPQATKVEVLGSHGA